MFEGGREVVWESGGSKLAAVIMGSWGAWSFFPVEFKSFVWLVCRLHTTGSRSVKQRVVTKGEG